MPKNTRIPVAYENPRTDAEFAAYRSRVEAAVRRMGAPDAKAVVDADESYVAASFRAEIDPQMTAAVIYHKHAGGQVVAGEPGAGALVALGASCPPMAIAPMPPTPLPAVGPSGSFEPPTPPAGANGPPPPADGGGPFTKIVRDEKRFAPFRQRALDIGSISSPKQAYALLAPDLGHELQECFVVVGFDVNMVVLCYEEVARGQVDHVAVAPGDVLAPVLITKCKKFLVAHNHPSGDCRPSDDDKQLTGKIKLAAAPFAGLVFLDHLVIGRGEVWSFTEGGKTKC
jgi:proteasome lid subunit RPN8/RPN11